MFGAATGMKVNVDKSKSRFRWVGRGGRDVCRGKVASSGQTDSRYVGLYIWLMR